MKNININDVLNCKMGENGAEANTIKDYLKALLTTLWREGEGFRGKRPFGNSGWEYDLYYALVDGGFVLGVINEYGEIDHMERKDVTIANKIIYDCIDAL